MVWLLMEMVRAADPQVIVILGDVTAPTGVSAEWFINGCNLDLQVRNDTSMPIEVDWLRSVYTPLGDAAVPILPGSASAQSGMMAAIPPMVVPSGAFGRETLFRRDRLPAAVGRSCLFDPPGEATVTIAISGGWLVQHMTFTELPFTRIDVHVGEVCFLRESVAPRCVPAKGPERSRAWIEVGDRMRGHGCINADETERRLRTWKSLRIGANWTVPWFYTTPIGIMLYAAAGSTGDKAERAYAECFAESP